MVGWRCKTECLGDFRFLFKTGSSTKGMFLLSFTAASYMALKLSSYRVPAIVSRVSFAKRLLLMADMFRFIMFAIVYLCVNRVTFRTVHLVVDNLLIRFAWFLFDSSSIDNDNCFICSSICSLFGKYLIRMVISGLVSTAFDKIFDSFVIYFTERLNE